MAWINTPLFGLVIYLIFVGLVGLWTYRKNESKEDFILGGRKLGAWVIAFSERTAGESAWLLLGLSGAMYATGLVEIWTILGCVSGIILYWFVIARKLRIVSEQYGAITLPEYFFKFCGEYGQAARVLSMLIITFFFAFYIAAQFIGGGKILEVTFGFNPLWGMVLAAGVVILYTMMGGFLAVCYTDVIQGILMVVTLVIMPVIGLTLIWQHGYSISAAFAASGAIGSVTASKVGWPAVAAIVGGLSWGLGYMGQPHLVTKFMAIQKPEQIRQGRIIAIIWTILAYGGAALVGVVGLTLLYTSVIPSTGLQGQGADPERLLPVLANFLFPAWLAGILISGAVAAMMSTADSQLLVTTSTIVEDFYSKALRKQISAKKLLLLSRVVTVLVGLAALGLAATSTNLIYDVVSMAWSGLGASFGPAILLSLHWKKMNGQGVIAGMVAGAVTTPIWQWVPGLNAMISVRFVSFAMATLAAIIVALLTQRPEKEN